MLTFFNGCHEPFCDGISRRSFLRAGGLALGGLALSDFLRLKAQGAVANNRAKSVIMIILLWPFSIMNFVFLYDGLNAS